ncbi:hypothetical protein CLM83_30055, partial [Streptomyces albidoflavus]
MGDRRGAVRRGGAPALLSCVSYTSDAADEHPVRHLAGRRLAHDTTRVPATAELRRRRSMQN